MYFYILVLDCLLFLPLLLLVVTDFNSDDIIDNDRETKTSIMFLPRDEDEEEGGEGNYVSQNILFYNRLLPLSVSSHN